MPERRKPPPGYWSQTHEFIKNRDGVPALFSALDHMEKIVWIVLRSKLRPGESKQIGSKYIALDAGIHIRSVLKAVRGLHQRGLILTDAPTAAEKKHGGPRERFTYRRPSLDEESAIIERHFEQGTTCPGSIEQGTECLGAKGQSRDGGEQGTTCLESKAFQDANQGTSCALHQDNKDQPARDRAPQTAPPSSATDPPSFTSSSRAAEDSDLRAASDAATSEGRAPLVSGEGTDFGGPQSVPPAGPVGHTHPSDFSDGDRIRAELSELAESRPDLVKEIKKRRKAEAGFEVIWPAAKRGRP